MRCDLGFSAKSSIALIAGLFGLLAVVGDQPWLASLEANESAVSKPDLVAYFVSWHVTERGSSHDFHYVGSLADPQSGYDDSAHSMAWEMTGSAIERYRADNGVYFDTDFLIVTIRRTENRWSHRNDRIHSTDCFGSSQDIIIDPGAYSGFHADAATQGGDPLGSGLLPDREKQTGSDRLENSFYALMNMRFTSRYTNETHGDCQGSYVREYQSNPVFSHESGYPDFPVFGRPNILEADSADHTSFSLKRQFTYTQREGLSDEKRYVTWTAHAYRMGKCAAHDAPIQAGDPIIDQERVDIDADRPEVDANTSAGADANIAKLKIRVTCEGVPVENAEVEINVDAQDKSGGHLHSDDERPRGTIDGKVVTKDGVKRATDANGEVKLKYGAPLTGNVDHAKYGDYNIGIAGTYKVTAKSHIPDATGTVAILAKVDGLVDLPANPHYEIVRGDSGGHPDGTYGTPQTLSEFGNLANDFYEAQKDHNQELLDCKKDPWDVSKMSLNDIALPDGGIFDWHSTWKPSHQTHNRGEGGDFNRFGDVPWTGTAAIAKECDGTSVKKRAWLLHTLMELGKSYGHWDCSDLGGAPGCEQGEPPTSVGYITASTIGAGTASHPKYPPSLHLHVQD